MCQLVVLLLANLLSQQVIVLPFGRKLLITCELFVRYGYHRYLRSCVELQSRLCAAVLLCKWQTCRITRKCFQGNELSIGFSRKPLTHPN